MKRIREKKDWIRSKEKESEMRLKFLGDNEKNELSERNKTKQIKENMYRKVHASRKKDKNILDNEIGEKKKKKIAEENQKKSKTERIREKTRKRDKKMWIELKVKGKKITKEQNQEIANESQIDKKWCKIKKKR